MKKFSIFLLLLATSGCLWQPQSDIGPFKLYNGPSAQIYVEVDSARTLSGVETVSELVYPESGDTVQNLIVNGTQVWSASPPYMDSSAPYYLDGRTNTVEIVWPHVSKTDTESFQNTIQLVLPKPTDTVDRTKGLTLQTLPVSRVIDQYVTLDDGIDTVSTYLDTTGTSFVADTSLAHLHGPWVRITLNTFEGHSSFNGADGNEFSTNVLTQRSIQYPMK